MDKIASGTFEGPNVKTGWAGRDARQHRRCLAFGTRWSLNGHEARLNPAGARYSQSPMDADGGGDGPSWTREVCFPWSILTTTQIKVRYPKRDLSQIDPFFIGRLPNQTRRVQTRVRQDGLRCHTAHSLNRNDASLRASSRRLQRGQRAFQQRAHPRCIVRFHDRRVEIEFKVRGLQWRPPQSARQHACHFLSRMAGVLLRNEPPSHTNDKRLT